jgi:hypothetical protein
MECGGGEEDKESDMCGGYGPRPYGHGQFF